jgi:hypothetical protein
MSLPKRTNAAVFRHKKAQKSTKRSSEFKLQLARGDIEHRNLKVETLNFFFVLFVPPCG